MQTFSLPIKLPYYVLYTYYIMLLNCPAETIHVTRRPQITREPHAGQPWPKQCQMVMRSEHGMLRASMCHVHRTELANYRRSYGTQAVLNQQRIALFLMSKKE